jgi:hypothetical protein
MRLFVFIAFLLISCYTAEDSLLVEKIDKKVTCTITPYKGNEKFPPTWTLTLKAFTEYKFPTLELSQKYKSTPYVYILELRANEGKNWKVEEKEIVAKIPITEDLKQILIVCEKRWLLLSVPKIEAIGSQVDYVDEFRPFAKDK